MCICIYVFMYICKYKKHVYMYAHVCIWYPNSITHLEQNVAVFPVKNLGCLSPSTKELANHSPALVERVAWYLESIPFQNQSFSNEFHQVHCIISFRSISNQFPMTYQGVPISFEMELGLGSLLRQSHRCHRFPVGARPSRLPTDAPRFSTSTW